MHACICLKAFESRVHNTKVFKSGVHNTMRDSVAMGTQFWQALIALVQYAPSLSKDFFFLVKGSSSPSMLYEG